MTYNVAIVGTGLFATDKHLPVIQTIPELKPHSAFNRTKSKAEVFATKAGILADHVFDTVDELVADPEVSFIDALLPVQSNLDIVKKAIAKNKAIGIEKPVAANLDQAREIVRISEASDVIVAVWEQWAFFKAIEEVRNILPKIGDVISFTYRATGAWNDNNKYLATGWRQKPEHIGGFLSDGGVHQLALLTEILGPVASVSGLTKQVREASGTDDILYLTFKLKSGAIGTFTYGSAFGATEKSTSLTIFGTNGSIVYDFLPELKKPTITYQTGLSLQTALEKTVVEVDEVDSVREEFTNMVDALKKGDKSVIRVPPRKAFHHLAIVAAALESSKNGGDAVKVEDP